MASAEETRRRPSVTSSSVGLEALFPAGTSEHPCGDGSPELERLRERLRGWLSPYEPALLWLQRLLVWERPLYSVSVALTLNTLFWLLSYTSLRPLFLSSVFLLGLVLLERWKPKLITDTVPRVEVSPVQSESLSSKQRLLSVPELSHHLAESYLMCRLFLHDTLYYKRHHHGKFCAMMCSSSFVLAVVGHYVPGIMIFYIIGLSVILWPLVVYHEVIQRMYTGLEPILMKLDYSMKGETERRKHDKRKVKKEPEEGDEPSAETESESENELSRFAPTVDVKTTALAMAITDSELSDEEASILESGGFSVSRATTPQLTDVSEDLDQPSLHGEPDEPHLTAEIPSVERGLLLRVPQGDRSRSGAGPVAGAEAGAPQNLASPLHFVNTHFNGHGKPSSSQTGGAPRSLEALSEEIVSTAISAVVRNTLSTLLRSGEEDRPEPTAEDPPTNPEPPVQEEEEEEDFELLDQSELEQAGAPGTGTPPLRRPS